MVVNMFNAQDAKKLTEDAHSIAGAYMQAETQKILSDIQASATKGLSNITVSCTDGIVQSRLRNLGFITNIVYDQRDGDYMSIMW